jgi:hypothetical protein
MINKMARGTQNPELGSEEQEPGVRGQDLDANRYWALGAGL